MLEETRLDTDELERLGALIPGPEPVLAPGRIVPVCETRLDGNELRYLTECVTSNWISSAGPFVGRFEEAFARAAGCARAVSCSSGTAALHLVLAALGLKAGDEVVVPAFTMIATANAVAYTGATPVFADSDPVTWNVTAATLEPKITPRTRALVVVHTYGHPADMDPIRELADRAGALPPRGRRRGARRRVPRAARGKSRRCRDVLVLRKQDRHDGRRRHDHDERRAPRPPRPPAA